MSNFIDVAKIDEIPVGTANSFTVEGKSVAVFNIAGTVHALEDRCLHRGFPLSNGVLEDNVVRCPAHGWRYDLATGGVVNAPGLNVKVFPAKIVDGRVLIDVG